MTALTLRDEGVRWGNVLQSILQKIVLALLPNSTSPDLYFTTIPGIWIALIIQCTMDISYQHGYLLQRVFSHIRSLESTYDLHRPYGRRRNGPERRRRAEAELSSFLSALYAPISKHFAKVFKPTDPLPILRRHSGRAPYPAPPARRF